MIKVGVVGGTGKLGKEVIKCLLENKESGVSLGAVITSKTNPNVGYDAGQLVGLPHCHVQITDHIVNSAGACQVYFDITNARALNENFEAYCILKKPLIIASTGFDMELERRIKQLAEDVPVLVCENFSRDVYRFIKIIEYASAILDKDMDAEVIEIHGKTKKDKPSGTAAKIANTIHQRRQEVDTNQNQTIPIHSLRMGNKVGEHKVVFINSENVQIELSHQQFSRHGYAQGMIDAASWIMNKEKGLFGIDDLFG